MGVLLSCVLLGRRAPHAGIQVGDLVVRIGGDPVEDVSDLRRALQQRAGETFAIEVIRDGESMDLDVTRFARVLVLTRPVARGELLTADMLRSDVLDVRGSAAYLRDPAQAAGRVAKRRLEAGTILDKDMIAPPILVQRNRPVRLVVER